MSAMSVAFGVFTSDPNLLRCELLRLVGELLTGESASCNAVGVGSYAQDEILFQRFRSALDLASLSRRWAGAESAALLHHACELSLGMSAEENTQPFRYRQWMFCQTGPVSQLRGAAAELTSSLPDFLRRQIQGEGIAELVFALFLKLLHESGRLDEQSIGAGQAAFLLGRTIRQLEELSARMGSPVLGAINCVATNGSLLVAARHGALPLYYRLFEGAAECPRCGIDPSMPETLPLVRAHRRRRTVVLASHPTRPSNWIEIENQSAIAIGRDLSLERLKI
jgi:glutamine amidotransferase